MTVWVMVMMWGTRTSKITVEFKTEHQCMEAVKTVAATDDVERDLLIICRKGKKPKVVHAQNSPR